MNRRDSRRRLLDAVLAILVILLPALVAGVGVERAARAGEIDRLAAAVRARDAVESGPDLMWIGLLGGASDDPEALQRRLPLARFAAPLAILVVSGLLWLTLAIARGRIVAGLSCVFFAALPPVWADGHVLRGELAVAVFGALALLLLVSLPQRLHRARRERPVRAWTSILLLGFAIGTSTGLAVASGPAYGFLLFVPACIALLCILRDGRTFLRVVRRFRGLVLPFRAVTLRTLPYVVPGLTALSAALVFLPQSRKVLPTLGDAPLLGTVFWLGIPLLALATIGALRLALRVAVDIARRRRIDARTIVAVQVGVSIAHRLARGDAVDALPAAPAVAVLCAEGAFVLCRAGAARLSRA